MTLTRAQLCALAGLRHVTRGDFRVEQAIDGDQVLVTIEDGRRWVISAEGAAERVQPARRPL